MGKANSAKRALSLGILVIGGLLMLYTLYLDFIHAKLNFLIGGSKIAMNGPFFILGAIILIYGFYIYPTENRKRTINILFLFPLLFTFVVTVIVPMFVGIFYSFTNWNGVTYTEFVGVSNYTSMFKDPAFTWSLCLTFLFVIFNMVLINVVAFLLALLCTSGVKGQTFFRAAYFLPNLIGGIVLGYIWQFIFNNVLTVILNSQMSILANSKTAFMGIVVVYIWQYAGYIMLIYINGLTTIPLDVLEAANIDGASRIQTLFKIKIPMIASTFTICTFLTLTSAFKQFDVNLALTNGTGSIEFLGNYLSNGTQMIALNIYNTAFARDLYGLAQAKAILFFIILAIVSMIQVRVSNSREVEL